MGTFKTPDHPPPSLFINKQEVDYVKQVNDEVIEGVVGQTVLYFPLSIEKTNYHPVYGEAIEKTYLSPIRVYALVSLDEYGTETAEIGVDKKSSITVHFHKRRLTEDQNLFVREGDFVQYGEIYYEIVTLSEPKQLFGKPTQRFEISAKCIRARDGKFNAG